VYRLARRIQRERAAGHGLTHLELHCRKGHCGRDAKLTDELRQIYVQTLQRAADNYITIPYREVQQELESRGMHLG
jgi:hypothetical protein